MIKPTTVNLNLRLPPELHQALVESAAAQNPPLSLNREIIRLLSDALASRGREAKARAVLDHVPADEQQKLTLAVTEVLKQFQWMERVGAEMRGEKIEDEKK
jgi:hypothetical protein